MQGLNQVFTHPKPIIGVVHLAPLPGAPRFSGTMHDITTLAVLDAETLVENGVDGIIIENYGDVPFRSGDIETHTTVAMTVIVQEIRNRLPNTTIGVNVLRNDAHTALAIASVCGADFIRVNVHTGAALTDQGIIQGAAYDTLRYRTILQSDVRIFADVAVKHAAPLAPYPLAEAARDTYYRGQADALIVTGAATGQATQLADIQNIKAAVPEARIFVGSGATTDTVSELLEYADGIIVGTALKRDGITHNAVDAERVRAFVEARS
jgi:membrane complex biogenesis BtpA family protein